MWHYTTVRGEGKRNATWRAAAAPRLPCLSLAGPAAVGGPLLHEPLSLLQQVAAPIRFLHRRANGVSERHLDHVIWIAGGLGSPVPERRPKSVHGAVGAKRLERLAKHGRRAYRLARRRPREHPVVEPGQGAQYLQRRGPTAGRDGRPCSSSCAPLAPSTSRCRRSNSDHFASRTSAVRMAVRHNSSSARSAMPSTARRLDMNSGISTYGSASWCSLPSILLGQHVAPCGRPIARGSGPRDSFWPWRS